MERSATRDLVVGLFVLAGIGAVAYLSISIGGFSWHGGSRMHIIASFGETGDLNVRAPVVIAGVRVGEVSKIDLDKTHYRAVVDLALDPNLGLTSETKASIVTAGMLGDRYVELTPGNDDKLLKSGDELSNNESAMTLETIFRAVIYGLTKDDSKKPASTKP